MSETAATGLTVLTRLTFRNMSFLNVVYVLARNNEPRAPKDVAARFNGCSHQRATAEMYKLVRAGAARWESGGGRGPRCRPTAAGVEAMRHHFRQWRDVFSEEDDRKAMAA